MKTIDQLIKELPEPERKICILARMRSKEKYPNTYDDTQTAPTIAVAIQCGWYWGRSGPSVQLYSGIHKRALAGEFDSDEDGVISYVKEISWKVQHRP